MFSAIIRFLFRRTSERAQIVLIHLERHLNDKDCKEMADYFRACVEFREKS